MKQGRARISHIVIFCYDFRKMLAFYTGVLGFHLSDIGKARGNDICFLTLDPGADHHQLALASGRSGPQEGGALNHVAFRVDSLAELRRRHKSLQEAGVAAIDPVTHGSWLSVYYRDPEGNRLEFFWDTPYYVRQPVVDQLDLGRSDEQLMDEIVAKYGNDPSFKTMDQWRADTEKSLA
jgi:catechol 2,3-dioxygenase-like lactoylglutathione lyase family enzyme